MSVLSDGPFAGMPRNHFGAIVADPPWHFKSFDGKKGVPTQGADPYDTMSLADLKALPVGDIAAKDCVLLMWTVSHLQDEASDVARAWGFTPKSVGFIWDKQRVGMGYWVRQEAEICKLFTRGKPKRLNADVRQMIRAPRREHSRKPDDQYERTERLTAGPYLEMFARQTWPGWTAWGNQVDRFGAAPEIEDLLAEPKSPNDETSIVCPHIIGNLDSDIMSLLS